MKGQNGAKETVEVAFSAQSRPRKWIFGVSRVFCGKRKSCFCTPGLFTLP